MDIVTDVLTHFPIIAQVGSTVCSKGAHNFHRVVGLLVINIHQWGGGCFYTQHSTSYGLNYDCLYVEEFCAGCVFNVT